jgi:hypothetical protein
MNYALIKDGVVTNLIWLSPSNAQDFPNAVPTNGLSVRVGDTYTEGAFYRNGEKVLSALEIAVAEAEDMKAALALLGVNVDE